MKSLESRSNYFRPPSTLIPTAKLLNYHWKTISRIRPTLFEQHPVRDVSARKRSRHRYCAGEFAPWPPRRVSNFNPQTAAVCRGPPCNPPIEPVNRSRSNPQLSPREAVVSLVPSWGDARRSRVLRDRTECSPFRVVVTRVVRPVVSTSSRSILASALAPIVLLPVDVLEAGAATRPRGATTVRPSDSRT